jgi:hypothetical protein
MPGAFPGWLASFEILGVGCLGDGCLGDGCLGDGCLDGNDVAT